MKRMNIFDENTSKNWRIFMKCKILRWNLYDR